MTDPPPLFSVDRFAAYAKGMQEIEEANVRTKSEGDKLLQSYEKASLSSSTLMRTASRI